jgi:Ca2+-binding EF-hand superfamily protein
MYASLVLAILVATVIPPCMLNAAIRKFEAEEIIAKHKSSLEGKRDDTDPLFVRIAITSKGMWGLLEKLLKVVSTTGLGVEDFTSTHSNGTDSRVTTTFFLRDTKFRVMIKKVGLQRSIRNLALSNEMSERIEEENRKIESRLREIQGSVRKNLESIHVQSIDTCQWLPFDAYLDGLFTGSKRDPSLTYLTSLFHVLDIDGGGTLNADELRLGLESNGFHVDDSGLKIFLDTVDQDGDGEISFNEWKEAAELYLEKRNEIIHVESD